MKHLIFFLPLVFFSSASFSAPLKPANADIVVKAMFDLCAASVTSNLDPADQAVRQNLAEFAADQAIAFAKDGGRVFALPGLEGNAVMMTMKSYPGACSVAVREVSAAALLAAIDAAMKERLAYRLLKEKRETESRLTKREFNADIDGPVAFLISVSERPRPGAMQALLTIARVKK